MNSRKMLALAKEREFPVEMIVRKRTPKVAGSVETLAEEHVEVREADGQLAIVPYDDVKVVRFEEAAIERWIIGGQRA